MIIPELREGMFSVVIVDYRTGHVLNKNKGVYLLNSDQEFYYEFESRGEAYDYSQRIFNNDKNIEILIYNNVGELVENFRPIILKAHSKTNFFQRIITKVCRALHKK